MITAPLPVPAGRLASQALVREALDRIDERLDPADCERGLGAVVALMTRHAQGLASEARLALASQCVAQRLRQEAAEELLATVDACERMAAPVDMTALRRRLRRKARELSLSFELRLPGRLARADEALQALAASTSLSDTLRGFVLTTASRHRVLEPAWIERLEALAPLLQSPRSPLATLTAACAQVGLQCRALGGLARPASLQQQAVGLFIAFAGAAEVLSATRARLAGGGADPDRRTLAALDHPEGLTDLACLAIGSTPVGRGERHGPLCGLLTVALESPARGLVDQALQAHQAAHGDVIEPIARLLRAWTRGAQGAPRPLDGLGPASPCNLPLTLQRAVEAYLQTE